MTKTKLNTTDLCMIGLLTAVIVIMAQIQMPMPSGVPVTMQTFAILLTGIILGPKKGLIAALIYVLLGAVGVPVFTGFKGGLQSIAGPTGGFILSFPLMAFFAGLAGNNRSHSKILYILYLALAFITNYTLGIIVFCLVTKATVLVGFTTCVLPFIAADILKAVLAAALGIALQKRLHRQI